ncbi:MAG TPA: FHA domain-containing protein [Gemmatimonadaceae bacterium]|nr:FHA domain-containing protein [Gemmatimonadaceae bacterium]
MNACAFCGRDNLAGARFCIDCGKPLSVDAEQGVPPAPPATSSTATAFPASAPAGSPAMAAVIPMTRVAPANLTPGTGARCGHCGTVIDPTLPFCAGCGERTATAPSRPIATCPRCSTEYDATTSLYCARCGTRLPTPSMPALRVPSWPTLALLGESGEVLERHPVKGGELTVGRGECPLSFPDDIFLSPVHARFDVRDGQLWVRDLGSRNGTWVFLVEPGHLLDGDCLLVGSQVLRFRRLGYPGPQPPEADATRRIGSLVPSADVAVIEQLRADGSVRDRLHLSPGRSVAVGREAGDWVFPYDQTMSGLHAEIRSEGADFYLHDLGSKNGVAIGVRGERAIDPGQRVLLGDQMLCVESP